MARLSAFSGKRLRQAREARGISVAALAEVTGVTVQAAHKWEKGTMPRGELLAVLAEKLQVPPAFFFEDFEELASPCFFRSRLSATRAARDGAEARLEWLDEITQQLCQHVQFPPVDLPDFKLGSPLTITEVAIEEAASNARSYFGLGEAPVANVVALLESRGVIVSRTRLGEGKLDAFSAWVHDRPFVFLNADKQAAVRSRFDAAHELGHLLLHREHVQRGFLKDKELFDLVEKQANRFASAFLLPRGGFKRDLGHISLDALLALKPRWGASVASMLYRAGVLGVVPEATTKWQWTLLARRGWKTGEPLDDVIQPEQPSLLRQAFELARSVDIYPERALALPLRDVETLCGLPAQYLDPPSVAATVTLKSKGGAPV